MRNDSTVSFLLSLVCLVTVGAAPAGQEQADQRAAPIHLEKRRTLDLAGAAVAYTVTVEETVALDAKGKPGATLVSFTYTRADVRDRASRPVVFAFNGGPGSSSVWLHMGLLGPRRVSLGGDDGGEETHPRTSPPFALVDNAEWLLDVADIVLFDPPGTGFSRVMAEADEKDFYGVQQDARVTSDFIRDWLSRHGRMNSPRFLMAESYGSIRAAVVAKMLAGGPLTSGRMDGLTLNGVILLGQSMDMGSGSKDIDAVNALPSLAATAWYHGKADRSGKTLEQRVDEARTFAGDDLLRAHHAGARLAPDVRARIAERLARLTGLPTEVVLERDLRVDARTFASRLLEPDGRHLGLYDGRFTLPSSPSGGDPVSDDPAMGQYVPSFVGAFDEYLRTDLGLVPARSYDAIEFAAVNGRWDYGGRRDYAADLGVAMRRNPALRVFVGTGYFDLVTTLGAAEYTVAHAGMDPPRVTWRAYPSGHMPYIGVESRRTLVRDLREFLTRSRTTTP